MRIAVVVFPGTNCDHDVEHLYGKLLKEDVYSVWHRERDLKSPDLVILPGGFAYGDYLRTGALAKVSPVMQSVVRFAEGGGKILGVCNGFQVLCEAQLLPGALLENVGRRFLSQFINLRVETSNNFFTGGLRQGEVITCPIAHFQGNYFADPVTISELERNKRVVFRYCRTDGSRADADPTVNVNGSINSIGGICNREGNIVGLMPHPERAAEALVGFIGSSSGLRPFQSSAERT